MNVLYYIYSHLAQEASAMRALCPHHDQRHVYASHDWFVTQPSAYSSQAWAQQRWLQVSYAVDLPTH